MWPFTKYTSFKDSKIFNGFTDWHCHLLPGVDDGIQKMEDTLQLLDRYESLGLKTVWLTPHIMEDIPNTSKELSICLCELKEAYKGSISLNLAAEYMIDHLFEERLYANDLLPIGDGKNHLLVETSYFNPPMGLIDILEKIKSKGYYPVLAHPERYIYMEEKEYNELKDLGVKFQLNLPSLVGMYGHRVKKKAEMLLNKEYYNLIGSDTHRESAFMRVCDEKIEEKTVEKIRKIVACTNL